MRRMLPPAAAVLLSLTACAYSEDDELRAELAAVTAEEEAPRVPDSGEGEGPEEDQGQAQDGESLFEPVRVPTDLVDPEGSVIGSATLLDGQRGITLTVEAMGLDPGYHGVGLHEVGDCATAPDGDAFGSVGDLLLPLPAVLVLDNGVGVTTALVDEAAVVEELLADDGTAVVVGPAAPEPAGAGAPPAGSRAACAAFGEDTPPVPAEDAPEGSSEEPVGEEDPNAVDRGTGGLEDDDEDTE